MTLQNVIHVSHLVCSCSKNWCWPKSIIMYMYLCDTLLFCTWNSDKNALICLFTVNAIHLIMTSNAYQLGDFPRTSYSIFILMFSSLPKRESYFCRINRQGSSWGSNPHGSVTTSEILQLALQSLLLAIYHSSLELKAMFYLLIMPLLCGWYINSKTHTVDNV